ncbi:MAG: hypothetical protein ISS15_03935 [Alphaproteobacteria bacterium]|nr:hypothetical protein [Alphaproteobacteria bacterium]MBL6939270.1 hypothetical protein [Alphaproteobacteria bacterium]MBL7096786.1 hypothetical protein [Alphaproteobacteria bacterium]
MKWIPLIAYFFGGALFTNAIPHFVAGVMGLAFQSPFAKPPGQGHSSSTVNVLWGFVNFVLAYPLLAHVGVFDVRNWLHAGAAALGSLLIALFSARHFGRFNGGNAPKDGTPTP